MLHGLIGGCGLGSPQIAEPRSGFDVVESWVDGPKFGADAFYVGSGGVTVAVWALADVKVRAAYGVVDLSI